MHVLVLWWCAHVRVCRWIYDVSAPPARRGCPPPTAPAPPRPTSFEVRARAGERVGSRQARLLRWLAPAQRVPLCVGRGRWSSAVIVALPIRVVALLILADQRVDRVAVQPKITQNKVSREHGAAAQREAWVRRRWAGGGRNGSGSGNGVGLAWPEMKKEPCPPPAIWGDLPITTGTIAHLPSGPYNGLAFARSIAGWSKDLVWWTRVVLVVMVVVVDGWVVWWVW